LKNFREEPPEVVKENIDFELAKISENQKGFFSRKKIFLLLSFLTICAIGAISIYSHNSNSNSIELLSKATVNTEVQNKNFNKNAELNNNKNEIKNSEIHSDKSQIRNETPEILNHKSKIKNQKSQQPSGGPNQKSKIKNQKSQETNSINPQNNNVNNNSKTIVNTGNKTALIQENTVNTNNKTIVENKTIANTNNQTQIITNSSTENVSEITTTNEIIKNTPNENLNNNTTQNVVNNNSKTESNADSLNKNIKTNSEELTTTNTINQPNKKRNKILKNFSLELFAAPVYTTKSVSALNVSPDYLNLRKENEKSLVTYNLGLELKYSIKNFFLQAGINYSKVGEKIDYNKNLFASLDTSESGWQLYSYLKVFVDTINWDSTNGFAIMTTSVPTLDSIWEHFEDSVFNSVKEKGNNELTYIEIPLMIGYSLGKGKLSCQLSAGVSYGILSGTKGKLLRTDASGFNDIVIATPYRKNIYNFLFRIGCSYHFNEKISVFLQPSFKLNLNSVFESSYPVSQKYKSYGLNIGLNYKL
jgi:hypothetical protein